MEKQMGELNTLIIEVGVPSTGGSGGGGPNKATFTPPEPQGILGLNSVVVYGGNFQVAFPLNFQLAFGSNLQICINPASIAQAYCSGAATTMPPAVNQILGSGMGGNMQLTMGASTNFVIGQSFDINLGPKRIQLDVHNTTMIHKAVQVLGTIIPCAVIIFLIAYGATHDDDGRAALLMIFQFLMQVLLMALVDIEFLYNKLDDTSRTALDEIYGTDIKHPNANDPKTALFSENTLAANLAALGVLTIIFLPLILESEGEAKLDTPQPS